MVRQKAFAKNSSKLNNFLHSEVIQLIRHIIIQDQDGQNNNILATQFCNNFFSKSQDGRFA